VVYVCAGRFCQHRHRVPAVLMGIIVSLLVGMALTMRSVPPLCAR
jgi:hypothetical protein